MSSPIRPPRKAPKAWILLSLLAGIGGLALIVFGLWKSSVDGLVYGFASLTVSALLGLAVMNRMFPRK